MYILSKRSLPSDNGKVMHHFRGYTIFIGEARAWFRSTRTTDVIEVPDNRPWTSEGREGNGSGSYISEKHIESWREQAFREELELAKLGLKKEAL